MRAPEPRLLQFLFVDSLHRTRVTLDFSDMLDAEFLEQLFKSPLFFIRFQLQQFHHREQVFLDSQFPEYRSFLSKIAKTGPGTKMHRITSDVDLIELDATFIRAEYPGDHVEGGGLSSTIRTQQTNDLAPRNFQTDFFDGVSSSVGFGKLIGPQGTGLQSKSFVKSELQKKSSSNIMMG